MSDIKIFITTINASDEALCALRRIKHMASRLRRDRMLIDISVMSRRYGPLRYLMPRWWRLRKLINQRTASAA